MAGPKPRQSIDAATMSKTTTIKITTRIVITHLPCLDTIITIKGYPLFLERVVSPQTFSSSSGAERLAVILTDQRVYPPSGGPLRERSRSPPRRPAVARP